MLAKFEVENFKLFKDKIVLDFTESKNYEFNTECVKNNIINKALIYGHNGSGKSNLGFAIFDIVKHVTDKESGNENYGNYLNGNRLKDYAKFEYTFQFDNDIVKYEYSKKTHENPISETLTINNKKYLSIDRKKSNQIFIDAKGAESLNQNMGDSKISIISYLKSNAILEDNRENNCFHKFLNFVQSMLFFRSLDSNCYMGFKQGRGSVEHVIIETGNLKNFENFLNDAGIQCKLDSKKEPSKSSIYFKFQGTSIPFYEISSQGTRSLALFYCWYISLKDSDDVKFLFIDEFDAFYHHLLSEAIVKKLVKINAQLILTSHNTSIITNDLLRPDCYFFIKENHIKSLANRTNKELREAHNIEKMYRAGAFDDE